MAEHGRSSAPGALPQPVSDGQGPTFILIGAAKAGTTTLYHVLREHPQVWMSPVKEPHYFSVPEREPPSGGYWPGATVSRWSDYVALFDGAGAGQARGEASVDYLHGAGVPTAVRARVPDVRLLAVIRNPVDAARSRYWMAVRHEQTRATLEELIEREPVDPPSDLPFTAWTDIVVRSGFHAAHLRRWIDAFGRDALLILTKDDLDADPGAVLTAMCEHIGVDPTAPLDRERRLNEGYAPRSTTVNQLVRRPSPALLGLLRRTLPQPVRSRIRATLVRANDRPIPPLAPDTRQRLLDTYRDDTLALEEILGRDLSAWRR